MRSCFLVLLCLLAAAYGSLWSGEKRRSIAANLVAPDPLVDAGGAVPASDYYIVSFLAAEYPRAEIEAVDGVRKIVETKRRTMILVKTAEAKSTVASLLRGAGILSYKIELSVEQTLGVVWDLDRLDQPVLPLDNSYTSLGTAPGVSVYIVDSGMRVTHAEFTGRATRIFSVAGEPVGPCGGHANWVAALAAGATVGVARSATIVDLKVGRQSLNCSFYTMDGVDALGEILSGGTLPGVINLSWQGPGNSILDDLIADLFDAGFVVVAAAGNAGSSTAACDNSPARSTSALSVGATNIVDNKATFSNFGSCVDIYAPGVNVVGASADDDFSLVSLSGTSGSTPLVAGVAAVYYGYFGFVTPQQVTEKIRQTAVYGVIDNLPANSGNRLLNFHDALPEHEPPHGVGRACGLRVWK